MILARRHGVRPHQYAAWIRRKNGPDVAVWRQLKDGSLGCAVPCVLCQKELLRFDMRVYCSMSGGCWYHGRLDEEGAPPCKPTTGQSRLMFGGSPPAAMREVRTAGARPLSRQQLAKHREHARREQQLAQLELLLMREVAARHAAEAQRMRCNSKHAKKVQQGWIPGDESSLSGSSSGSNRGPEHKHGQCSVPVSPTEKHARLVHRLLASTPSSSPGRKGRKKRK